MPNSSVVLKPVMSFSLLVIVVRTPIGRFALARSSRSVSVKLRVDLASSSSVFPFVLRIVLNCHALFDPVMRPLLGSLLGKRPGHMQRMIGRNKGQQPSPDVSNAMLQSSTDRCSITRDNSDVDFNSAPDAERCIVVR